MVVTLAEAAYALTRLNGLQHLGQVLGYHLMVDPGDCRLCYWVANDRPARGWVSFHSNAEAWLDCLITNHNELLLGAMVQCLNYRLTSLHWQFMDACAAHSQRLKEISDGQPGTEGSAGAPAIPGGDRRRP